MTQSFPPHIFIGYSDKNSGFANRLKRDLCKALQDDSAIVSASDRESWDEIYWKLTARNRKTCIFVLSSAAVASQKVKDEIDIALRRHVSYGEELISLFYRKCETPAGLAMAKRIDFRYRLYDSAFNDLLTALDLPTKNKTTIQLSLLVRLLCVLLLVSISIVGIITTTSIVTGNQHQSATPSSTAHIRVTTTPATVQVSPAATSTPVNGITPLPNLYPNPPGTLVDNPFGQSCQFSQGAYHVSAAGQLGQLGQFSIKSCFAGTNFSDFVYEAQVEIVHGDYGGIMFRYQSTPSTAYYAFLIGADGTYQLIIPRTEITNLRQGSSSAIKQGHNAQNLLAVVAKGTHIDLYINNQYITSVIDQTISRGGVGFTAAGVSNQTDVVFTNPILWIL